MEVDIKESKSLSHLIVLVQGICLTIDATLETFKEFVTKGAVPEPSAYFKGTKETAAAKTADNLENPPKPKALKFAAMATVCYFMLFITFS